MAAFLLCAGMATSASAQAPAGAAQRGGNWEIGGGIVFVGGLDLGNATAELTPNTGTPPSEAQLFQTESRLGSGFGLQGRIGFFLTRSLSVEGGVRWTRPKLEISVTDDLEDAPDTTAEETIDEYVFDGSAVYHFSNAAFSNGRGVPFVTGGAGYLRELHEERSLIEDGWEFHAGGGIKWGFGARGRLGLRAEGGLSIRNGGVDPDGGSSAVPYAGASVFWVF